MEIFFWQHYNSEKVYVLDFLLLLRGSFIDNLAFPSLAQQKIFDHDFLTEFYVVRRKIFPQGSVLFLVLLSKNKRLPHLIKENVQAVGLCMMMLSHRNRENVHTVGLDMMTLPHCK